MPTLYRLFLFCLPAVLLLCAGCDSDDGNSPVIPTRSNVSFILNGTPYSNTNVELRDNVRGMWLTASTGRLYGALDALASIDATGSKRIVFTITIPAKNPGKHDWIDPQGAVLSNSGVFLEVHEGNGAVNIYQAVQGSTTLGTLANVGAQIEGSFSGVLRSTTDGSIVTISNGVFSLTRLTDQ